MNSFIIPPKIKNPKKKKNLNTSIYKESKIGVHTTINGKGIISRIRKNKNG